MAAASASRANRTATPGRLTIIVAVAPLAQSAEHSHGKAGVIGSIPIGGSHRQYQTPSACRRSPVGKSTRLIIEGPAVRARPPLPNTQDTDGPDTAKHEFDR